jgi:hypothetical protein
LYPSSNSIAARLNGKVRVVNGREAVDFLSLEGQEHRVKWKRNPRRTDSTLFLNDGGKPHIHHHNDGRTHRCNAQANYMWVTGLLPELPWKPERKPPRKPLSELERRERRNAKRRAARAATKAPSLNQLRPWEAGGVSRRTWYRHKKHGKPEPRAWGTSRRSFYRNAIRRFAHAAQCAADRDVAWAEAVMAECKALTNKSDSRSATRGTKSGPINNKFRKALSVCPMTDAFAPSLGVAAQAAPPPKRRKLAPKRLKPPEYPPELWEGSAEWHDFHRQHGIDPYNSWGCAGITLDGKRYRFISSSPLKPKDRLAKSISLFHGITVGEAEYRLRRKRV